MRAMKMQKPGLVTRLKCTLRGSGLRVQAPSRHEYDRLVGNVGTAPAGCGVSLRGEG